MKKKKIIQITGINFDNKGSELMLIAILNRLNETIEDAEYAIQPTANFKDYLKISQLGMYQILNTFNKNLFITFLQNLVPKILYEKFLNFLRLYGIILDRNVDIVLDAAGFAYSDEWSTFSCLNLKKNSKIWKKNLTKVIYCHKL